MLKRTGTLSRMFRKAYDACGGSSGAQGRVLRLMKDTIREDKNKIVNGIVEYMSQTCDQSMIQAYKHLSRKVDN